MRGWSWDADAELEAKEFAEPLRAVLGEASEAQKELVLLIEAGSRPATLYEECSTTEGVGGRSMAMPA